MGSKRTAEMSVMPLTLAPLFSSSKGNSTYIASDRTCILIDAGVGKKQLTDELKHAGADAKELSGIVVTHEHGDHIKSVGSLSRAYNLPVYANEETWKAMEKRVGSIASRNIRIISPTDDFYIGDLCVQPIRTSHDAACSCAYSVTQGGSRVSIITDLGYMPNAALEAAAQSRIVLLESNYDPQMLADGPYAERLKKRIASNRGHLSNADAAKAAEALFYRGVRGILLSHISPENNMYSAALGTVSEYLREVGIEPGRHIALNVAQRTGLTGVFRV